MNQEEINGKPATKKLKIPTEEWHTYNSNIRLSKTELNKLIMNFFIVEGTAYIVIARLQGCRCAVHAGNRNQRYSAPINNLVSQEEIESMTDRIEVKRLILDGRIDAAIEKLESTHPEVIDCIHIADFAQRHPVAIYAQAIEIDRVHQSGRGGIGDRIRINRTGAFSGT
jgi:hypothetical protein